MFFTSNGWNLVDGKLTSCHIIAIVFIAIFIVSIFSLTIGFMIYMNHVKRIYEIDKKLTILTRSPLQNKVNRVLKILSIENNVSKANKKAFKDNIKIIYLHYLQKSNINAILKELKDQLDDKKILRPIPKNISQIKNILKGVEKTEANFNTLNTILDDILKIEFEVRDLKLDLIKIWEKMEKMYKVSTFNNKYPLNEMIFKKYKEEKNRAITLIEQLISDANFEDATNLIRKVITKFKTVSYEITKVPLTQQLLFEDLTEILKALEKNATSNSAKERYNVLKSHSSDNMRKAISFFKESDNVKGIHEVDTIKQEIIDYRKEIKFESELKSFFENKGETIIELLDALQEQYKTLESENSEIFRDQKALIKRGLIDPIRELKQLILNFNINADSRLVSVKEEIERELFLIVDNISLLYKVKTNDAIHEEKYIEFLNDGYTIKTNLFYIDNILKKIKSIIEPGVYKGLSEKSLMLWNKLLVDFDFESYDQFKIKKQVDNTKLTAYKAIKEYVKYSKNLKEEVYVIYMNYLLSTTIIAMVEMVDGENKLAAKKIILRDYAEKNYIDTIRDFVRHSQIILN